VIYKNKGSKCISLPVEALLEPFYRRFYPFKSFLAKTIAGEYFYQKRYIDEEKSEALAPADFMKTSIDKISERLPKAPFNQVEIAFRVLDMYAEENNAESWAVCDYLPERFFEIYKKFRPYLKLVTILRNPREAICASLYWRSFPEKNSEPEKYFYYSIMLWALSAKAYLSAKKKFGGKDVFLLRFNELIKPESEDSTKMSEIFGIPKDSFSLKFQDGKYLYKIKGNKFLTPDGDFRELLTQEELKTIDYFTSELSCQCGIEIPKSSDFVCDDPEFETLLEEILRKCEDSPNKAGEMIKASKYNPFKVKLLPQLVHDAKRIAGYILKKKHESKTD